MSKNGKLVVAALAGLFAVAAPLKAAMADDAKKDAKVQCKGVNECKGKGGCAGATNSCAGKNECKGKGVTATTAADCKTKGGTVAEAKEKK